MVTKETVRRSREPNGEWKVEGERHAGFVQCGCGAEIELVQEVDEWYTDTGEVTPGGWGPATGVCEACGLLFVDDWNGCSVYRLDAV